MTIGLEALFPGPSDLPHQGREVPVVADVGDPSPPHDGQLGEGEIEGLARPRPPEEVPAQGPADPPQGDHGLPLHDESLRNDFEVRDRTMPRLGTRPRVARPLRRREGDVVVDDVLVERRGEALEVPHLPLPQRQEDDGERFLLLGGAGTPARRIPIDQVLQAAPPFYCSPATPRYCVFTDSFAASSDGAPS